jgi:hypothetical protein
MIGAAALFAGWFFLAERRHEDSPSSAVVAVAEGARRPPSIGDARVVADVKPHEPEESVHSASREQKMFAKWSTYHSTQGGFSVYLPDQREEKQHVHVKSLGLDGDGVEAHFVQLPNTDAPIESWPAIGEVWLRAMWVENSALGASSAVPAGATQVTVGDLSGTEFVEETANETQKVRLFVQGDRTILLSATFVGESRPDSGLPFGEGVDRFLNSLRLDQQGAGGVAAAP